MASSSAWMPPAGCHTVNIGASLNKAIKNRKLKGSPAPTTKRSNLPDKDFYSFKFKFRASSIDDTKPASIETTQLPDSTTQVRAEYPSTQAGEVHKFSGIEQLAKDVECILIYDEETGIYTLEKLDSLVQFKYDGKGPDSTLMNKGKSKRGDSETSSLVEESVKAEDQTNLEEIMRQAVALRREEEEEEEEEEGEIEPLRPLSPVPPPKPSRVVKSLPKARPEPPTKPHIQPPVAIPPPQPAKATPVKAKKVKQPAALPPAPPAPVSYPDEEVIEFGKPAKRARASPPAQSVAPPPRAASPMLSLPGGSAPISLPPAPVAPQKPATSRNIPAPAQPLPIEVPPSPPAIGLDSDDDEDDWDEVPTEAVPIMPQHDYEKQLEDDIFGDGFADATEDAEGGEDIDLNAFEEEMNEQMRDSEDDFVPDPARRPISLNELASREVVADSDEDDYSSSDDSDED